MRCAPCTTMCWMVGPGVAEAGGGALEGAGFASCASAGNQGATALMQAAASSARLYLAKENAFRVIRSSRHRHAQTGREPASALGYRISEQVQTDNVIPGSQQ